jgi:alpha-L-rhamnosidase
LGGLQWMEGTVPTPKGQVQLYCSTTRIRVKGEEGTGTLRFKSKSKPSVKGARVAAKGNNLYELTLAPGKQYTVTYKAM